MPTKLSKLSLRRAVGHVAKYGDTDVLPHPVESVFLSERKTKIVDELAALDLDTFKPAQGVEIIAPKSRLGFRIVHQLPILETLLLTAAVIEIGGDLEKRKRPIEEVAPPLDCWLRRYWQILIVFWLTKTSYSLDLLTITESFFVQTNQPTQRLHLWLSSSLRAKVFRSMLKKRR